MDTYWQGLMGKAVEWAVKKLSPPPPGTNWADWSNTLEREMYLRRALAKLNSELPRE